MKILRLLLLLAIIPSELFAFPDMIRKGYTSCSTCHVSPGGGQALTDYGRGVSSQIAMIGNEQSAKALFGLEEYLDSATGLISEGLTLRPHGDVRYLKVDVETERGKFTKKFLMQQEFELTLDYKGILRYTQSIGKYEGSEEPEIRRAYAAANIGENLSIRFGRFLPVYGLMLDDHSKYIRKGIGFDQNSETVNFEANIKTRWFDLFAAEVVGKDPYFIFDRNQGIRAVNDSTTKEDLDRATALKLAVYPMDALSIGASGYFPRSKDANSTQKVGVFGLARLSDSFFLMGEYDKVRFQDGRQLSAHFVRLGWEAFHGWIMRLEDERLQVNAQDQIKRTLGVQILPVPHIEITAEASFIKTSQGNARQYLTVYHFWL